MKNVSMLSLAAVSLLLVGTVDAGAFQRSGTVNSQRGTGSYSGSVACSNGTCSRNMTRTGANGRTMTNSGSLTKTGPGQYSYSGSTTGPNGRSRSRSGGVVITNGQ